MKKQTRILLLCFLIGGITATIRTMVFDNRFIPLIQRPYILVPGYPSHFRIEGFFAQATRAYDPSGEEIPLPLLFGSFDQAELGRSLVAIEKPNPFAANPEWIFHDIPWDIEGKLQTQGFALAYQQQLTSWVAVGFYTMIMRANSRQDFFLKEDGTRSIFTEADKSELDRIRRDMFKTLGLDCGHSDQFGPGDLELYLRFGQCWDYAYKFRRIDFGVEVGALVATGVKRNPSEPTSIPFGGNGHHGIYGSLDAELELKEDLTFGLLLRVNKRFARTQVHRLPVDKEPSIFGVICGQAKVTPGPTVIFSPYLLAENLRDGFGAGIRYVLTSHQKDKWCDKRSSTEMDDVKVEGLKEVEKLSGWGSDYITLNAFYDFGKLKIDRGFRPIFSVTWDVPTSWFVAHNVAKTTRVTLGLDFSF